MYDFFQKADKTKRAKNEKKVNNEQKSQRVSLNFGDDGDQSLSGRAGVNIFYPKSFADVEEIIDLLLAGKQVVVNLKDVKDNTAQRVLDILCGAVYALKGGLCELERDIYVITPDGVSVK